MTHKECLQASRHTKLVDDDKFERHIRKAKLRDSSSRSAIFDRQTEHNRKFKTPTKE